MSTVTIIKTRDLRASDVLLIDQSTIGITNIEPDEWDDDTYIVETYCASGNMEQWDGTSHRVLGSVEWRALDLER